MKKITLVLAVFSALFATAQTQNVTFQVDMSNYTATTYTGVFVNSTFNNWCGSCNPMTDANNDDIWEVTLPLVAGTAIEFKYTLDGWTGQETLPQSLPCTKQVATNNNRDITVPLTADTILPVVCWEACVTCSAVLPLIDLPIDWEGSTTDYTVSDFGGNVSTLVVDPTNASNMVLQSDKTTGAQTWAGTTLSTPVGFANAIAFSATSNIITAKVWSATAGNNIMLKAEDHTDPTKSVETYANSVTVIGWQTLTFDFSTERPATAAINYTYTYDKLSVFYDHDMAGTGSTFYIDDIVFGSGPLPGNYNVTFQVDMNDYTGSFTTPEVNGLFNNWCGNCAAMTDANSDGIWEITIPIADDSTEYKFSYDNWAGQETLLPGSSCTKTVGANTNRFIVLTGDTVLPPVCWESCANCTGIPTSAKVTFKVDLSTYSGTYTTVNLNGTFNNWCGGCAVMTSPNNDDIYEIELVVPTDTIEFKYTLDGWTAEETLTEGLPCTRTVTDATGTFTNRILVPSGDTILPAVCWEACDACGTVGIAENNWISDFKVTPNPSNGVFNISGSLNSNELIQITVTDIQGRVIYQDSELNNNFSKTINISFAQHGMYILKMASETNVLTEKIIYTK